MDKIIKICCIVLCILGIYLTLKEIGIHPQFVKFGAEPWKFQVIKCDKYYGTSHLSMCKTII